MEQEFLALSKHRRIYYQVRYLDEKGMEVVRVDSDSLKSYVVPKEQLQDKSDRYYFKDSIRLNRKQLFVSKLDLNRERGKVEVPYKPVIRYAMRLDDSKGKKAGIVITNIDANQFLMALSSVRLATEDGFYASHPDKDKRWGRDTDLAHGYNLEQEYPELASKMHGRAATLATDDLTLSSDKILVPGTNERWTLIVQNETKDLLKSVYDFRFTLTVVKLASWRKRLKECASA